MKIRTAILLAANRIAKRPDLFDFIEYRVPKDCGTPGCVLGWIRFYHKGRPRPFNITPLAMKVDDRGFYDRMSGIANGGNWRASTKVLTATLRLYADKYHPLKRAA